MSNTIEIKPGALITLSEVAYVIKGFDSPESIEVVELESGVKTSKKLSEITNSPSWPEPPKRFDLNSIDPDAWAQAMNVFNVLKPLLNKADRTKEDVEKVANELFVSVATAYRYLEKIEAEGTVTCLIRKPRADKFTRRLMEEVEDIIKKVLLEQYLNFKKISPERAYLEIERLCRKVNSPVPAKQTVIRRIHEISRVEHAAKREGRNAALDLKPNRGTVSNGDFLNSLWQIDHTLVDIILVDEEYREPISRPWITVVIDVYSRMVMGWYISFDPPGSIGTGLSISTSILPKEERLIELESSLPWPCQGKPTIIMADNAKEFRGNMLKNACAEHGIELRFRPVKKPNYGGHIERMMGTLMTRIHALDGTTFSNISNRENYDSEAQATMTLKEFEKWMSEQVLGKYHHEKHSALGCSPLQKYKEGIMGNGVTPGIGFMPIASDPQKLIYDFLPFEERVIQPLGACIDYISYHDPVLDKWIGAKDPNDKKKARKFVFRRDPRKISPILFWDPHALQYFPIHYRDTSRRVISVWELNAVTRYLRDKNEAEIDEELIFQTYERMRAIEEEAAEKTKATRLMNERRKHHAKAKTIPKAPNVPVRSGRPELPSYSNSLVNIDLGDITAFDEVEKL